MDLTKLENRKKLWEVLPEGTPKVGDKVIDSMFDIGIFVSEDNEGYFVIKNWDLDLVKSKHSLDTYQSLTDDNDCSDFLELLEEGQYYSLMDEYSVKPLHLKLKDNKLNRKIYKNRIDREEDGFIYVEVL